MKNRSKDTKEEIHQRISSLSKTIRELSEEYGIPFKDTTAEHKGQTSIFFSMRQPHTDEAEESEVQLTPEKELERIRNLCEKYNMYFDDPPELMKLLELPLSQQVEVVREDIESGADVYRTINPYVLGALFHVPFENLCENHMYSVGDWTHYFCVPKMSFSEYVEGYMDEEERLKALSMTAEEQEAVFLEYAQGQADGGSASTLHVYDEAPLNLKFGFERFCDMGGCEWRSAQSPYDYRDDNPDELVEYNYLLLHVDWS